MSLQESVHRSCNHAAIGFPNNSACNIRPEEWRHSPHRRRSARARDVAGLGTVTAPTADPDRRRGRSPEMTAISASSNDASAVSAGRLEDCGLLVRGAGEKAFETSLRRRNRPRPRWRRGQDRCRARLTAPVSDSRPIRIDQDADLSRRPDLTHLSSQLELTMHRLLRWSRSGRSIVELAEDFDTLACKHANSHDCLAGQAVTPAAVCLRR
ncbi:hypothetical protein B0G82_2953 [Paraburkholderia sp. BL17N1]|nr:hypothetical protein B0G82_2953 [Paraburkholderia sp. BL17N1]